MKRYKINNIFKVPFPLRVLEGVTGDPISLKFNEKFSRRVNLDEVTFNLTGSIVIYFPRFEKFNSKEKKDIAGSISDSNGQSIKSMYSANCIEVDVFLDDKSIKINSTDLGYFTKASEEESKEIFKHTIKMVYNYDCQQLALSMIEKFFNFLRLRSGQHWLNQPLPISTDKCMTAWFNTDGMHMGNISSSACRSGAFITKNPLDKELWKEFSTFLRKNKSFLIYEQLICDAKHMYAIQNNRRSILDLATAIESFCSKYICSKFRSKKSLPYFEKVDRYIKNKYKKSFKNDDIESFETIRFLFEARNNIIHYGDDDGAEIKIKYELSGENVVNKVRKIGWVLVYESIESVETFIEWVKGECKCDC